MRIFHSIDNNISFVTQNKFNSLSSLVFVGDKGQIENRPKNLRMFGLGGQKSSELHSER